MRKNLITLLLFLASCADYRDEFNPLDAGQIPGFWVSDFNPAWSYWFTSDGVMIQREIVGGMELQRNEYTYSTAHDSIYLRDIYDGSDRIFTVYFDSDTAATLTEDIQGFIFQQPIKKQ